LTEIADMAVTESLSNIVMDVNINHSAIRAPKTVKEFKGKIFCLKLIHGGMTGLEINIMFHLM
jgi:hypothetical protein